MISLLVSFYLGGYISNLLNARSQGNFSLAGSLYLLMWPLYGIIILMELISEYSDDIVSIVRSGITIFFKGVKRFVALFRS